jgi:hypothetical protein
VNPLPLRKSSVEETLVSVSTTSQTPIYSHQTGCLGNPILPPPRATGNATSMTVSVSTGALSTYGTHLCSHPSTSPGNSN